MGDFKNIKSFQKAFSKIKGYDETKVFFIGKSKPSINGLEVHFVSEGKLLKIKMYMSSFEIFNWSESFEEYFATGVFPTKFAWIYYAPEHINPNDINKKYYYDMIIKKGGYVDEHSEEFNNALYNYRKTYPECGIMRAGWYQEIQNRKQK